MALRSLDHGSGVSILFFSVLWFLFVVFGVKAGLTMGWGGVRGQAGCPGADFGFREAV